ncbi:iron-sulfur cluster repair protein YtfE [Microbulbifer rhizosphaerae]|uniref:Regulator of cell morphogenesis and NO signaling n=1 Tax=Microbulbifer rhizosphaerae TaxID=1562603 RepID=A0A7W4Z8I4_9GAMM|nr:iron-sulfur cluster repair protein YtfE [Microbulbifer rhizosphaerae]MBB3059249.1 regulator of cell morphogenesis and NO signaling [Microbulbifer rhizosphaerae]
MNTLDQPLGQLARQIPGATAVFFAYRLDFCNGGKQTLREATAYKALDAEAIAAELDALIGQPETENWDRAPSGALIEHILTRYHEYHRQQLPQLIHLAARVESVHRGHPECPAGLADHLEQMFAELERHMQKEEEILFPMIMRGMSAMARAPVAMMRHEHHDHVQALQQINKLTRNLTLPNGACNTWYALYLGLATLERDLEEHIHLENNLLFERIDGLGGL